MDPTRFDALVRTLAAPFSRRTVLAGSAAFGPAARHVPAVVLARKRKKNLKRNEFGCVNVGGRCRGKDSVCCSGICGGKKPKKGTRDRSRCVAHGVGICTQGQDACAQNFTQATRCSQANPGCFCGVTTGKAGFCGDFDPSVDCFPCRSDTDCATAGFPAGSACVRFVEPGCACPTTGGTACVSPCV